MDLLIISILVGTVFLTMIVAIILLHVRRNKRQTESDFYTKHGLGVWLNGIPVTKNEIETVTDFLIEELNQSQILLFIEKRIRRALKSAVLYWESKPFSVRGVMCNGSRSEYLLRVVWPGSVHKSAYYHELAHKMLEESEGDSDGAHALYPELWRLVDQIIPNRYEQILNDSYPS